MSTSPSTALIAGGTSGIGRSAANKLAALGAHVIVVDRNAELGQKTVAEIRATGGNADLFRLIFRTPRLGLTLRRGTDNNLAHVNIGGLLNREHDGSSDRVGRDPHFVHAIADLVLHFRTGHGFREVRVHEAR